MIGFLCTFRPRSTNAKNTEKYKEEIRNSFKYYYPENNLCYDGEIYGISYYFHRRKTDLDADNLSKPIWDALNSILYKDDKIIKLRYSGVYDLGKSVTRLDLTKMPQKVYLDFLEYIEKCEHIIYIELGKLQDDLYVMGGETHETIQ
jgi:Holliday junction resolvase RusA-like endonuclease